MKTILIIGCGSIGERHVRCFLSSKLFNVIACDTQTDLLDTIAKTYSVPITTNWKETLSSKKVDAVLIATPANLHISMAENALLEEKHVLIEKPLSVSLDGIKKLIDLRNKTGRQALVAYTYRSMPVTLALKTLIEQTSVGPPLSIQAIAGQHFPTFRPAYSETYYREHSSGGGAIQDGLTHMVNTVEWLAGSLEFVFCDATHSALDGVEVEDSVNLTGRTSDTLCNFSFNQFQAPNENVITIHCKKGSIRGEYHRNRIGIIKLGESRWNWRQLPKAERDTHYVKQAKSFNDAIEGKSTSLSTLEEAKQSVIVNLAALESARTGQPISLKN